MRQIHHESASGHTTSPNLQSEAGFWGARHQQRPTWSREICDTVGIVGSDVPHIFRTIEAIEAIEGVVDSVKVGMCWLHDDLSMSPHRIYDDRGFGNPICTAILLTEYGKELLKQLQVAA